MVRKLRKIAESKSDSQMAKSVRESAQQIWLAGLGAFVKAREDGSKVFETLVKEGSNLQSKTREIAGERLDDVADRVGAVTGRVSRQASESWDRLEQVFEQRVARALVRLGLPTAEELAELSDRVDRLAASVVATGGSPTEKRAAARKAGGRRSAVSEDATDSAPAKKTRATGATKTARPGSGGTARKTGAAKPSPKKSVTPGTEPTRSGRKPAGRKPVGKKASVSPADVAETVALPATKSRVAAKKGRATATPASPANAAPGRTRGAKAPKSAT